jgi:hypothetical protein
MRAASRNNPQTPLDREGRILCSQCEMLIEIDREYDFGGEFTCEKCIRDYVYRKYEKQDWITPEQIEEEFLMQLRERSAFGVRNEARRIRRIIMSKRGHFIMPEPNTLDLYFRAHTRLAGRKPAERKRALCQSHVRKWTPGLLLFDCITANDEGQILRFGTYTVCRMKDGSYEPTETGIFSARGNSKQEHKVIERFAKDSLYRVLSQQQFTEEVFLPQLTQGVIMAGFGMPLQLSRIAARVNASKKNRRAFSLYFKLHNGNPSAFWPGVQVQNLGSGQSICRNLKVKDQKAEEKRFKASQIRILDLETLTLALTGEVYDCEDACVLFGLPSVPHSEPKGRIVKPDIERAMRRLFRELELLNLLKAEYYKHPVALHPDRALSPAGIVKSYAKAANLKAPFVSDYGQGIAMQAMAAGRAECCVRRTVTPVTYVDFHAQYPAVYVLQKCRELATAERLELTRCTKEARQMAETVTLERCLQPDFWPQLRFFALVESEGSILPTRCRYSSREDSDPTLGWNYLYTQGQPHWTTGFDVAAAALEGKPPRIIRAYRVMPYGKQATNPIQLYGQIPFNPATDDLPEKLVELRKILKKTAPHLASGLKVGANSAAAGLGSELDITSLETPNRLLVLSGETEFCTKEPVTEWEKPGSMFCPIISSFVYGGSHLLLAMLHKMIRDAGSEWLFCDTDGAALISNECGGSVNCHSDQVQALSRKQVDDIRCQFESLNPRKGTPFLKLEEENFPKDGKKRLQLYGYAVAAKRYSLFNLENGELKLRKVSGHGLAHLQPPYTIKEWERKHGRKWTDDLHPFIYEAWDYLLSRELKLSPVRRPSWLTLPAAMPFPVTTPQTCEKIGECLFPFKLPFTTLTMVLTKPLKYLDETSGEYEDNPLVTGQAQWIAPYTENLSRLYGTRLSNLHMPNAEAWLAKPGSRPYSHEVTAKTIGGELEKYFLLPESKFDSNSGSCGTFTLGLLHRKRVIAGRHRFIGKESSQRWSGTGVVMTDASLGFDETCREYEITNNQPKLKGSSDVNPWAAIARKYPRKLVAKGAKVTPRTVIRFCNNARLRTTEAFQKIRRVLMDWENRRKQEEAETRNALNRLATKIAIRDGTIPEPEMLDAETLNAAFKKVPYEAKDHRLHRRRPAGYLLADHFGNP